VKVLLQLVGRVALVLIDPAAIQKERHELEERNAKDEEDYGGVGHSRRAGPGALKAYHAVVTRQVPLLFAQRADLAALEKAKDSGCDTHVHCGQRKRQKREQPRLDALPGMFFSLASGSKVSRDECANE